jgi:hypothetical protein
MFCCSYKFNYFYTGAAYRQCDFYFKRGKVGTEVGSKLGKQVLTSYLLNRFLNLQYLQPGKASKSSGFILKIKMWCCGLRCRADLIFGTTVQMSGGCL